MSSGSEDRPERKKGEKSKIIDSAKASRYKSLPQNALRTPRSRKPKRNSRIFISSHKINRGSLKTNKSRSGASDEDYNVIQNLIQKKNQVGTPDYRTVNVSYEQSGLFQVENFDLSFETFVRLVVIMCIVVALCLSQTFPMLTNVIVVLAILEIGFILVSVLKTTVFWILKTRLKVRNENLKYNRSFEDLHDIQYMEKPNTSFLHYFLKIFDCENCCSRDVEKEVRMKVLGRYGIVISHMLNSFFVVAVCIYEIISLYSVRSQIDSFTRTFVGILKISELFLVVALWFTEMYFIEKIREIKLKE